MYTNKRRAVEHAEYSSTGRKDRKDPREAHRSLALFFCSVPMSPATVESHYFKEILDLLHPDFSVSTTDVALRCVEIYKEERIKVKELLKKLDVQVSISIDVLVQEMCWHYEFISVTAHYIDENWKRRNLILGYYRTCPDGVGWGEALDKSLLYYEIYHKKSSISVPNEDRDYMDWFLRRIKKQELPHKGQLIHMLSFPDLFSSIVIEAFEDIYSIYSDIHLLISWGRMPPAWDIKFHQLKEALDLESKGEFTKDDYDGYDVPSATEWEKVRGVCKIVDIIFNTVDVLFEAKQLEACLCLHSLREVRVLLKKEACGSDKYISKVAGRMLLKIDSYWNVTCLTLAIISVMDPRCKMKFLEYSSSIGELGKENPSLAQVTQVLRSLYDVYAENSDDPDFTMSDSSSSDSEEELDDPEKLSASVQELPDGEKNSSGADKKKLVSLVERFAWLQIYTHNTETENAVTKSELDCYLDEPVMPWRDDFSVLKWWRAASPKYPILSKLACHLLAIPISLATPLDGYYMQPRMPHERAVSMGKLCNVMMCMNSWLPKQSPNPAGSK